MPPPPPSFTLFPYTTLFRSHPPLRKRTRKKDDRCQRRVPPYERDFLHDKPQDRKSTRLNSSHITISYAVFCLKKKKKNITNLTQPLNSNEQLDFLYH